MTTSRPILVLGATGMTGSRVARRLAERSVPVRAGSRVAATPFEREQPATWPAALSGASAVYVAYLDGRNANLGFGIEEALGRAPREFTAYAHGAARNGVWSIQ